MSFKCELEIVEALDVPLSKTGVMLEPLVVVLFKSSGRTFRTRASKPTQAPLFSQCFLIEGIHETEVLQFTMYDRDVMGTAFVGQCELEIGAPTRAVGSRWLPLTGSPARLHVVWQCSSAPMNLSLAPRDKIPPPPETLTIVPLPRPKEEEKKPEISQQAAEEPEGREPPSLVSRVEGLERKLMDFSSIVEQRLHTIETQIANLSTFVTTSTRHVYHPLAATSATGTQLKEAPLPDEILATSAAPGVAKIAATIEGHKALDDIMSAPTKLTAEDEQELNARNFKPVVLPESRGKTTTLEDPSAPHSVIEQTMLDRKIVAATLGVNQTVRDSTGAI